jgi:hypothetical protein
MGCGGLTGMFLVASSSCGITGARNDVIDDDDDDDDEMCKWVDLRELFRGESKLSYGKFFSRDNDGGRV